MKKIKKPIPILLALTPVVTTVFLLAIQLLAFNNFDPQAPLLFGIFIAACIGVIRGWKWKDIESGMFNIIVISLPAIAILLLIGILIGSWSASGTTPFLVYYGLKLITPEFFLFSGFLLCAITSLALGTSWGTIGTLGVVIVGVGNALGFPIWLSAGPVVSGAFFGDKMSPISDTTNLAPAITGVKLYDHIKNMIPTTVPAMLIGAIIYIIIGFSYEIPPVDDRSVAELLSTIESNFSLNIVVLAPPLIVIAMAVSGFSAIPSMFAGVLSGLIIAMAFQGAAPGEIFEIISTGFIAESGNKTADNIFNRGGIVSMSGTMSIVFFALTFGGVLERIGCFDSILNAILKRMKRFWQLQTGALGGTILMILGTGDSYLPMAFIGRLFSKAYDKFKYSRLNLSRAIEEGGTLMTPLVPWSASGIFVSATLGLGIESGASENLLYIPLSIGCWLSPAFGFIFPFFGLFSKKATKEEIESYSDSESASDNLSQPYKSFLKWYNPPVSAYVSTPEIADLKGVGDIEIPYKEIASYGDFGYAKSERAYIIICEKEALVCSKESALNIDSSSILSANLTHFSKDYDENIENCYDDDIANIVINTIPSKNLIYALKIDAKFSELTVSPDDVEKIALHDVSGTAVCFYYPEYMKNIASGVKAFFIGESAEVSGRILSSKTQSAMIEIKQISKLSAGIPITLDFLTADFNVDSNDA